MDHNHNRDLRKHQWIAILLSLISTGGGMFYIGTPWMIFWAVLFIAAQGFGVIAFFYTLGFLGLIILPLMLVVHLTGLIVTAVYFGKRPRDGYAQQKRQQRFDRPGRLLFRAILGVALFAGTVYASYTVGMLPFTKTKSERQAVADAAARHLQQKYGETFEITEVRYNWANGSYELQAQPLDKPELNFNMNARDDDPPNFGNDYYLAIWWSAQLKEKLTPYAEAFHPGKAYLYTEVSSERIGDKNENVPRYDELVRSGDDRIESQQVEIAVFTDLSEDSLPEEQERIVTLVNQLKENMIPSDIKLKIEYYPSAMDTDENRSLVQKDFEGFQREFLDQQSHKVQLYNLNDMDAIGPVKIEKIQRNVE
ncbi:hypothetical protein [Paenibacillus lemnae]|uniref:RDD family protein n=1 Tax=Paenibacillus lemnae TaxID=1330551 RepID=A0A848M3Q2_PAELE|nr:hypothetical protein [Paenibacillus lemnae]NMO94463.1 RDD family protein [Paenibacillus lemnae]